MKQALAIAACLVVSAAVLAQHKPAKVKPVSTPKTTKCAVMPDNPVTIANAEKNHMYVDYKGKRYYMCCDGCPQSFKKDPAKYAKTATGFPIPKAKKKG